MTQDDLLQAANEDKAVALMQQLKEAGQIRVKCEHTSRDSLPHPVRARQGLGSARQIPKQQYSLEDLRLHKLDGNALLSPKDNTLDTIRHAGQVRVRQLHPQLWLFC